MSVLAKRMAQRMGDMGMGQSELGRLVGMSQSAVWSILKGDTLRPRKLREIAIVLNASEDWLLGEKGAKPPAPVSAEQEWIQDLADRDDEIRGVPFAGYVEAGSFKDPEELDEPPSFDYFVPRDPRFPLKFQRVWMVRGRSIERTAREGSILLCVLTDSGVEPTHGDLVIAERVKDQGGLIERTAKRLHIYRDKVQLVPEYLDERQNKPLVLSDGSDVDEMSVRIIAVVKHIYADPRRSFL